MDQQYTPEQVERLLYEAGRALMALRVPGCWPAGYRSGMPECLRDPEDLKHAETVVKVDPPSPSDIDAMDLALRWIGRLPGETPAQIRIRKLVSDRMQVSPRTDRPLYSWRKLGDRYSISHVWAKTLWVGAVAQITVVANRSMHPACAGTLARIRAHSSVMRERCEAA